jgi:uncharacterized protein (DUF362 family)
MRESDIYPHATTRRDFLARAAKAGAGVALTAYLGYRLHDAEGPDASAETARRTGLPDFSVPGAGSRMAIVTGDDRAKTIALAMAVIGGIETYVAKGDRVLLKVNAAFATPPLLGATTHPDLVAEVTRLCLAAGAASVVVTDNPINDPSSCFELSGIAAAARRAGATVVVPREDSFRPLTLPGATLIRNWPVLSSPLQGITKLIGLAPVKDHNRAGASMTLKNWYGLLGGRRNVFHQDIHVIIRELAMMVKPTLVILDGTASLMTNGPTGGSLSDLKPTRTMVVSTDAVAADAFGATLLGRQASDLPYITMAAAAGAGTANYEMLNPERLSAS